MIGDTGLFDKTVLMLFSDIVEALYYSLSR